MKEAVEVIENILKDKTPYEKTLHILKCYKDLKKGKEINEKYRSVISVIDKVLDLIKDDKYIDIIKCLYIDGCDYEETAIKLGMDKKTVYRQRRRIIKRISVIIYGDRAL